MLSTIGEMMACEWEWSPEVPCVGEECASAASKAVNPLADSFEVGAVT